MLTDIIPAQWRARLYVAFLIISGTLGAISVAFKTLEMAQPTWLTVSLTVLAFIAASVSALAKANVNATILPAAPVEPASTTAGNDVIEYNPGNGDAPTTTTLS